jgi:hypothetical protein
VVARTGGAQCGCLRTRHLHSRDADGAADRPHGELRLYPDAFVGCRAAVRRSAGGSED